MGERWKGNEFEFDKTGKLIIHDRELATKIAEQVELRGTLEITLRPIPVPIPNSPCPPPPDIMCGCNFVLKPVNPSINPNIKPNVNPSIKPGINPRKGT